MGEGEAERATVESGGEDRGVRSLIPSSGITSEVVGRRRARTVPPGRSNRKRPGRGSGLACWASWLGPGTMHLAQCTVACALSFFNFYLFFFYYLYFAFMFNSN